MADLGEGPGVKKEEMTEGKMADRASKSRPPPPPPPSLAQGLDPPLLKAQHGEVYKLIVVSPSYAIQFTVVAKVFLH